MFGFFRRRKISELGMRASAAIDKYGRLKASCPGAAYVFASTLRRTRDLVGDQSLSSEQKLLLVERNIEAATPDRGADGGISLAALRFVRLALASDSNPDGIGALMVNRAYVTIADDGKSYRDLEERDRLPPQHPKVQVPLQKSGFRTVAELVAAMRNPADRISDSLGAVQENIWNVLAIMDLREMDQEGWTLVGELQSAISGPFAGA
ncbi:hypothetical protein [Bradyrhizobium sp. 23AC]